jgi:hypothetical protein
MFLAALILLGFSQDGRKIRSKINGRFSRFSRGAAKLMIVVHLGCVVLMLDPVKWPLRS